MARVHPPFSILRFTLLALLQFALLLVVFRFALPSVWAAQFAAGWLAILAVFVGFHLLLCFFEWAFHRYVLHSVTTRWLHWFASGHRSHHGLTPIRLQPAPEGADRYILNRYPIIDDHQNENAAFPPYAIVAFWLVFSPLIVGFQLLWPHLPMLLGGYAGVTWSMCLYEILHAIEHWPYEWWKHATEHRRFGRFWSKLYGFHHMHHANVSCNEAIAGFFTLPVADWVLGTYHQPKELLLEGRIATAKDFAVKEPPAVVRWMDRWARRREARVMRREH